MKAKMMSVKNWIVSRKVFFRKIAVNYLLPWFIGGTAVLWVAFFYALFTSIRTGMVWRLVERIR